MDYTVLHIAVSDDEQAEILTAELADFPFESFETEDGLLKAYIPAVRLSGCKTDVDALLARRGVEGRYAVIPTQNWNASWESDFPPVDVEGRLRIRAPFHDPAPAGEMEAVVLPRMSFGTGHHATTWLMSRAVLGLGVAGRTGLDMGSGTGVLAIVAAKCGAAHVDAMLSGEGVLPFSQGSSRGNLLSNITDRWTEANPRQDVFYPRLSIGNMNMNYEASTWWLKNTSYLRLKNIELSYTLPDRWMKRIHINNARIFIQGVNLLTFSKFKLWDVELGDGRGAKYPNIGSVSLGINFNF